MFGWLKKHPESAPVAERLAPKRPRPIDAVELAHLLLDECVYKIIIYPPEDRPLDAETRARYEYKTKCYQLGGLLIGLLTEEQKEPMFGSVRTHIEAILFEPRPDGSPKLPTDVASAMQSLSKDLLVPMGPGKSPGRWANTWLGEIGVGDWMWNIVDCDMIGLNWMSYCIRVVDTLQAFKPVAASRH